MATLTITDVDAVRTEGSLKSPSDANGAASDRQIQQAIRSARRRVIEKVGETMYETVLGWSNADIAGEEDKDEQRDAFVHAESCYAIAHLARKLNGQQLSDTGIIQSIEIGKARQGFASSEESEKIGKVWENEGNRWLSPYLAVPLDDITQQPTSFASRKGSLYVGTI